MSSGSMMRILSKDELEIFSELWLEDLPRRILDTVCQNPGINQATVLRLFVKSLPTLIDPQSIYDRCLSSIYWFLYHGDIATSGNRRYVAIPPYAVPNASLDGKTILTIFGDPRLDQNVADSVGEIGCRLERKMVTWRWDNRNENSTPNAVGFLRRIVIDAMQLREIASRFGLLKIPIVQPHDLQARLPSIHELKTPSKTAYTSVPPNWGYWDSYAPYYKDLRRWKPESDWSTLQTGMLRWRPSDDRHGETNMRFFLVTDGAHLFELSSTSARLWALFLDWRENNPKQFWAFKESLWIPLTLVPEAHEQWLQLISHDHHRDDEFMKYYLEVDPEQVKSVLTRTLGLQPVVSTPHERSRR